MMPVFKVLQIFKCSSYDHLVRLLIKVMDEHPENVVDVFEDMSCDVKRDLFQDKQSTLRDLPQATVAEQLAEQQRLLFSQQDDADQEDELVQATFTVHTAWCVVVGRAFGCIIFIAHINSILFTGYFHV